MRGSRPVRPRRFRTGTGNAVHCPGLRRTTAAMMAKRAGEAPIIVVKRVRKVTGGHHGGAWKVAYADFVTAMMAFFLLLWLLNATTEDQKKAISNYFAPASVSESTSGAGGVLGGRTFGEGALPSMGGADRKSVV